MLILVKIVEVLQPRSIRDIIISIRDIPDIPYRYYYHYYGIIIASMHVRMRATQRKIIVREDGCQMQSQGRAK